MHRQGRLAEARMIYESILASDPASFDALNLLGALALQTGAFLEAETLIGRALISIPTVTVAHINRGRALMALQRSEEALQAFDKAVALEANRPEAHFNRANALQLLKRPAEALASYDQALALKPDHGLALNNRGTVLLILARPAEALASYDAALALDPKQAELHYNRGNALHALHRLDDAVASYDQAVALKPDYAQAYNNRGSVLLDMRRMAEALSSYDTAIALDPTNADAHNNRGNALIALKRQDDALASFARALTFNPVLAGAYANQANALAELKRLDDAVASYDKALAIDPHHPFLAGPALHTRMKLCDWTEFDARLATLTTSIRAGRNVSVPFPLLALIDEPELHRLAAESYVAAKLPSQPSLEPLKKRPRPARLRIGYFSADFRNHAVANFVAPLFEAHDRDKVEVYGFAIASGPEDEMRRRISAACTRFFEVSETSDRNIASYARELEIDIAVDLNGHTQHGRLGIFAERCAPVQVNFLGYPGTTGAPFVDYLIADETVIPFSHEENYTEKIIRIPSTFLINGSQTKISERALTRREFGLPDTGFVFCCFNNSYKVLPAFFEIWMRLLKAVPGSTLWLRHEDEAATVNLRKAAVARGVEGDRLVFARPVPLDEHLARHTLADLFIDSSPYNAHSTASDALRAHLPVLTCPGKSFASRVAASLLTALDLPELIAPSTEAYESMAIELANDAPRLAEFRRKLSDHRHSRSLFDAKLFARRIEAAYESIHNRYQAGLPPASLTSG